MFVADLLDLRSYWVGCVLMTVTKITDQSITLWLLTRMWRIVTMGHWTSMCSLNTEDYNVCLAYVGQIHATYEP